MKALLPLTLAMLIGFSLLHADTDKEALGKLTARIGDKFWSPPEKRLVRATIYGKGADDGDSAKGKSEEQKAASVLDFCAAEQLWPDFVIVEIYYS